MTDELAVETAGLVKAYGRVRVLEGIDLRVPRGSVFSLLGPNGAGKTTMVRILATLVRPDGGQARVAGYDVVRDRHQVRRRISLTGQYAAVDDLQTGAENLRMTGRLAGLSAADARRRAAQLLDRFDLTEAGRRRVGTYSGGMRRRLDLAASLVGQPAVIFLDEPTTGLDLRSRQTMWRVVQDLAGSGVTVFLTTQYLEEADHLADRIAVLDAGRIVAEGSPAQLKRQFGDQRLELTLADRAAYDGVGRRLADQVTQQDPERLSVSVATDGSAAHVRALLDDVFLALTGRVATPAESGTTPQKETARV
ncbi:MAG TPA: ATP-binding cassette domain-containing protein [Micromonosporaceae bacterium]|nr:ATP-binding cassette domain-containing protein [Micromonosporaceae bacterium]